MNIKRIILGIFVLPILLASMFMSKPIFAQEVIRLATTTSVYETGLLDYIIPPFEKKYNVKVHIISVGTGRAIQLAKNGDVDIILVHDREAEDNFIKEGYGVSRKDVAYNDFLIVGPSEDPAKIKNSEDVKITFKKIADSGQTFISRGDESGTHKEEIALWKEADIVPTGDWYLESGQGMTATLIMADEKNAYTLIDRASYISNKDKIRLIELTAGDKDLLNYYSIIAVNPDKYPDIEYNLAASLIEWITSLECQKMIDEYKKDGQQLFHSVVKN